MPSYIRFLTIIAVAGATFCSAVQMAAADGSGNTKLGKGALSKNGGSFNTAIGFQSMDPNSLCTGGGIPSACCSDVGKGTCGNSGDSNVAIGKWALQSNTAGGGNIAVGDSVLASNTTGGDNIGLSSFLALGYNTRGSENIALGYTALLGNTTGDENIALGLSAMYNNWFDGFQCASAGVPRSCCISAGVGNCARGNIALGTNSLRENQSGDFNVAIGWHALANYDDGDNNIALGFEAGRDATGSYNIDIGNVGGPESNSIRIGTVGTHTSTFIAGISGQTSPAGVAVFVNADGKLGTATSSARFKDDIRDMGDSANALMKLRPVRFKYKSEIDSSGLQQYGLIAEEVARIFPALVVYDGEGRPQTVRYHFVNAMLLNEVQKQHRQMQLQRKMIHSQAQEIARLRAQVVEISTMQTRLDALEAAVTRQQATAPRTVSAMIAGESVH